MTKREPEELIRVGRCPTFVEYAIELRTHVPDK